MAHEHQVIDQDKHFVIDPITRKIKSLTPEKNSLVRYDHNSERFTFEIPRYVDGHDMSLCNVIQIHYINISNNKVDTSSDVYEATDMYISDDNKTIIFSWLISRNATQYYGSLSFAIRFACTTEDVIDYDWHTDIYSGISISNSINNSNVILEDYLDVLENWRITVAEDMVGRKMDKENPTGTGTFSMNRKENTTIGDYSHAEGYNTTASGNYSHAEGYNTTADGGHSHAEGYNTIASSESHAEGTGTKAFKGSHSEGHNSKALGYYSHAEGQNCSASGDLSHSEGHDTTANGMGSHTEGYGTIASGANQHVQGTFNVEDTENEYAHIVGGGTSDTDRKNIHTIDWSGNAMFAGDVINGAGVSMNSLNSDKAASSHSHAISDVSGLQNALDGKAVASHSHDYIPTSASCNKNWNWSGQNGQPSWLWGSNDGSNMYVYNPLNFNVNYASSAGYATSADSATNATKATNDGNGNNIASTYLTKINPSSNTGSATGYKSIALGDYSTASGSNSVALGSVSTASGAWAIALGERSTASGNDSTTLGYASTASGVYSVALGPYSTALDRQTVTGYYNDPSLATSLGDYVGSNSTSAFVIGNGTSSSESNAFRVRYDGIVYSKGSYNNSGADYAEYLEWSDGNANNEDRRGYAVTFDEENPGKIRKANTDEYVVGIVSGNPCILGNSDEGWLGQYLRDDFGTILTKDIEEEIEIIDPDTGETSTKKQKGISYVINPDYDPQQVYIHRENRPEWDAIGFLGILIARDDNTCIANGYCKVTEGGIMTTSEKEVETYKVIERVTDNLIKVLIK